MKALTAIALATVAFSAHAMAADGTIDFVGNVVANTCVINAGSQNLTVNMGNVPASALATAGQMAGQTQFAISLTGCTGSATKVAAKFESGQADLTSGHLNLSAAADVAQNVQVAIFDSSNVENKFGQPVPASSFQTLNSGNATLNYSAWYIATGTATTGSANAQTTYTLSYQ